MTGACVLTVDGKKEQVALMNVLISVSGTLNIAHAIQDVNLFSANKEEILKDFAEFDIYVYDLMKIDKTKTVE